MSSPSIAVNRRAQYEYFISEKFEAGIVLTGTEVKSVREHKVNLQDAYVTLLRGEAFVVGMHIGVYSHAQNIAAIDPIRTRKLLLHKSEIGKLAGLISRKGLTCVPLSLYFKKGVAKVQIGVAKGKQQHDKRQALKKKMYDRETRQALKHKSR